MLGENERKEGKEQHAFGAAFASGGELVFEHDSYYRCDTEK